MTKVYVINKVMIKRKETIKFYFDIETEERDLALNSNERYIKTFRNNNIDATDNRHYLKIIYKLITF